MADIQRQELHCPECRGSYRFDLDFELDGNHEVVCPGCGHTHYRIIINGRITETRYQPYDSYATYAATSYQMYSTSSDSTTDTSYSSSDWGYTGTGGISTGGTGDFLRNSWMNSTSTT